jgi:hypothetical protein
MCALGRESQLDCSFFMYPACAHWLMAGVRGFLDHLPRGAVSKIMTQNNYPSLGSMIAETACILAGCQWHGDCIEWRNPDSAPRQDCKMILNAGRNQVARDGVPELLGEIGSIQTTAVGSAIAEAFKVSAGNREE